MIKCPVCGENVMINKNLIAPHSDGSAEICYGSYMPAPPEEQPPVTIKYAIKEPVDFIDLSSAPNRNQRVYDISDDFFLDGFDVQSV